MKRFPILMLLLTLSFLAVSCAEDEDDTTQGGFTGNLPCDIETDTFTCTNDLMQVLECKAEMGESGSFWKVSRNCNPNYGEYCQIKSDGTAVCSAEDLSGETTTDEDQNLLPGEEPDEALAEPDSELPAADADEEEPDEEVDSETVPDETQDEEADETPEPDEEEPQTSGCDAGFVQLTDGSCKPDCEHGTYNCPLNKRCAYDTTTNEPGCFACAEGYYGNDCMSCDINTFCSAHANICVFNSNNSSNTCTCLEGYTGATCGTCVEGYVNTAAAGEPLNCKKNCELCYDGIEYLDFMGSGLPIPMEAHGQCDYETQTCVCLDGWTTSSAVIVGMAPYCSVDPNASSGE